MRRKGIRSVVLERSETLRATGAALAVLTNGWRGLDELGVASKLRPNSDLFLRYALSPYMSRSLIQSTDLGYKRNLLLFVLAVKQRRSFGTTVPISLNPVRKLKLEIGIRDSDPTRNGSGYNYKLGPHLLSIRINQFFTRYGKKSPVTTCKRTNLLGNHVFRADVQSS